jgi:hypothetical protein
MMRYTLAILAALAIPACGGSGGSVPVAPVIAPSITFDSLSATSFSPPAKTTCNFTLSGGPASTGLNVWTQTAPNTLQFLGEIDTRQTTIGSHSYAFDGFTEYVQTSIPFPTVLVSSSSTTVATYYVDVQRQLSMTNGTTHTGAAAPEDIRLFYRLDHDNALWLFNHAEKMNGTTFTFPASGAVPGMPGWTYEEKVWIYDIFLDTTTQTLTYSLNPSFISPFTTSIAPSLFNNPGMTYQLELHSFNSSGESLSSPMKSVVTP